MSGRRWAWSAVGAALSAFLACAPADRSSASAERQAEVAERGRQVMPFDLERTLHVFDPLPDGGIQTVEARDPADAEQVRLVRLHLREEAARFERGDFADPAFLHGDEMPGLAALRRSAGRITIEYDALPSGGRIRYATKDPELVRALHAWFEAQLADHGRHARHATP